jgi:hypothetical protein
LALSQRVAGYADFLGQGDHRQLTFERRAHAEPPWTTMRVRW